MKLSLFAQWDNCWFAVPQYKWGVIENRPLRTLALLARWPVVKFPLNQILYTTHYFAVCIGVVIQLYFNLCLSWCDRNFKLNWDKPSLQTIDLKVTRELITSNWIILYSVCQIVRFSIFKLLRNTLLNRQNERWMFRSKHFVRLHHREFCWWCSACWLEFKNPWFDVIVVLDKEAWQSILTDNVLAGWMTQNLQKMADMDFSSEVWEN